MQGKTGLGVNYGHHGRDTGVAFPLGRARNPDSLREKSGVVKVQTTEPREEYENPASAAAGPSAVLGRPIRSAKPLPEESFWPVGHDMRNYPC
jgi:hypothetical protein